MAISAGGRASWQFLLSWQLQLLVERDGNFRRDGSQERDFRRDGIQLLVERDGNFRRDGRQERDFRRDGNFFGGRRDEREAMGFARSELMSRLIMAISTGSPA
jgi:hypothetical protein